MDVKIREANNRDIKAIITLWHHLMDFHRKLDRSFDLNNEAEIRFQDFLTENVSNESACVMVADSDGRLVGYMMGIITERPPVFKIAKCGTITDAFVSSEYRRGGIGRKLCEAMRKWFYEKGLKRIEMQAAVGNTISNPFWRSMGFKPVLTTMYIEKD